MQSKSASVRGVDDPSPSSRRWVSASAGEVVVVMVQSSESSDCRSAYSYRPEARSYTEKG
jgi:hypothetical protein